MSKTKMAWSATSLLTSAVALVAFAAPAAAATVTSESDHRDLGVIADRHYANFARLTVSDTQMRATADLHVSPGDNVPVGTGVAIGVYVDGAYCESRTSTVTTAHNPVQVPMDLPRAYCGAGVYTARGVMSIDNGAGTSTRYTYETPGIYVS